MKDAESTWFIVADKRRARLFRVGQTALGKPRLEERDSKATTWIESEHHRPSPLSGRGVQAYDSREKERLEEERYCAREIARWVRQAIERFKPERMKLVAPPRFMDDLRRELDPFSFDVAVAELAHLPAGQLARHPHLTRWLEKMDGA